VKWGSHLGEMPGVGGRFARVVGFSLTCSLHVKSFCDADADDGVDDADSDRT